MVGCVSGGSNVAGQFLPWLRDKISGAKPNLRVICVEPQAAPSLTKGPYAYDFGNMAGLLHHSSNGMAPIISHLYKLGLIESKAAHQVPTFEAGITFARTEGIISAPEPYHDIKVAIDEALRYREAGESKTILIAHSGHWHFDLAAYAEYLSGRVVDYEYSEDKVKEALASLPRMP